MKKTFLKLVAVISLGLMVSCNSDDDNSVDLTQTEILVSDTWNIKEYGLIVNNNFVADQLSGCEDMNFMKFSKDNTFYESDFFLENDTCVDGNVDEKGTWKIEGEILKRTIKFEGTNFEEKLEENIDRLDMNNLILSASQTDEQGNPETYYIHYIR
ncbi:lipocalin family protein [Aquimarina aquimarini]|uniref:lipocalin family protein n=1 Tax=Aquimarina aquimarini TaxID=1191734 RepID=UPI000D54FB37|nr:lipocalin family protein [Aquimarina aquimarini]